MKEYVCWGCNENCTWDKDKMEDMGLLIYDMVCDVTCPYSGMSTEFHGRDDAEDEEECEYE